MATKKSTTVKKGEELFYAVVPEQYPLENGDEITIFNTIEHGFFDTQDSYHDVDPATDKFFVYEIRKKGVVNVKVDINIS